jgi:taurine dioxygenase
LVSAQADTHPKNIDKKNNMLANNFTTNLPYPEFNLSDIDLSNLHCISKKTIDKIIHFYNLHHILIIRNQNLMENQLIDIAKLFGEPAQALVPTFRLEQYPVITRHTNMKNADNVPNGVVAPEYVFHADSYFTSNPSKATLFYCLKAPNFGGETYFINMCDVYDNLNEITKVFINDKKVSYKNAFINQPPVTHPIVRIHPVSGKKALFINKNRAISVDGMAQEDGLQFIEELYHYATSPDFVYKHKWCCGDLLIWNNITTMHCATPILDSEERLLYRILTKGDLPVT